MTRLLAFALGNPLRGDDGAGRAIGTGLAALLPGLELVETMELLPEHADAIAAADGVLFLDAAARGAPGEVRTSPLAPLPTRAAVLHALRPEELLGLARALHGRCPPAALVTIAGGDFSYREALSPEVAAALPTARATARDVAAALLATPAPDR